MNGCYKSSWSLNTAVGSIFKVSKPNISIVKIHILGKVTYLQNSPLERTLITITADTKKQQYDNHDMLRYRYVTESWFQSAVW